MPVLDKLVRDGAHSWDAYTIVPSLTLPSHTSMLTGVGIQKHQISWNDYKPENGELKVPTIFQIAHKSGKSTAMIVGKEKFKTLLSPGSVDTFDLLKDPSAQNVAKAFSELVKSAPGPLFHPFCRAGFRGACPRRPLKRETARAG